MDEPNNTHPNQELIIFYLIYFNCFLILSCFVKGFLLSFLVFTPLFPFLFLFCSSLNVYVGTNHVLFSFSHKPWTRLNPDPHPPRGCPSNSLGPVWANMYSDPFSSTTPAGAGIKNPDYVKWRETLASQEESSGRDIPMGQLVTKVLVFRESPLSPCHLWPDHDSPVPRHWVSGPDRCPHPRVDQWTY